MKKIIILGLFALPAAAAPTYTVQGEHGEQQRLVVGGGKAPLTWEGDGAIGIQQQGDFNGDGVLDALVWSSCGGNGCATGWHFVTVKADQLVVADIGETEGEARLKQEKGRWLVELDAAGGTEVYVIDGVKALPYATTKRPVLHAVAEVRGVGREAMEGGERSFQADVDLDGKPEVIKCTIWERWGSLLCELPLSGGGTQKLSTGCDRFGALPTSANGRREFVCNEDAVVRFDGRKWVEPALSK